MKPLADGFAVVTATSNVGRSRECRWSWEQRATYRWPTYKVDNGGDSGKPYLGTVPAFAEGVRRALVAGHSIIAAIHDDVLIEEDGWDQRVLEHFRFHPKCGLAGFLGGTGLGSDDLYKVPYSPHQLARQGVISNMRDAEAHGKRWVQPERVAVLDGFSAIGRAEFFKRAWPFMANDLAIVHHAYDLALGALAARWGYDTWMLPIAVHHYGGQTAVGDQGYAKWAEELVPGGDRTFWELAHDSCYREFKDVLPIRIPR